MSRTPGMDYQKNRMYDDLCAGAICWCIEMFIQNKVLFVTVLPEVTALGCGDSS